MAANHSKGAAMLLSRRNLIRSAASVAIAAPALRLLGACATTTRPPVTPRVSSIALRPDPQGLLDLAPGLSYTVLSRHGQTMSDGLIEPSAHDGMAAFPVEGDADRCILVRNHELGISDEAHRDSAFAAGGSIDPVFLYDRNPAAGDRPFSGGTTTLLVNVRTRKVERSHLSLAGTAVNCAGGPTPWGSWLSCEETDLSAGERAHKAHGFVFEVPASSKGPVMPVPLTGLGRFVHEAAAIDPATGIVYLTEDTGDSLFYRFLPNARGELVKGGRLQALALVEQAGADTRNWTADRGGDPALRIAPNRLFDVRWVDLDQVESPGADLRMRGRAKGAAIFARGEGMAFALEAAGPAIYFTCTSGGLAGLGQVWRYIPSLHEGTARETDAPPQVELFVESTGQDQFERCDNIVASPRGELIICEDGDGDNFVRAVAPDGLIYPIAREIGSEFCGACFSPDGSTLFVNVQRPGTTFAIHGDWSALRREARNAA
jgi:secreted PhoX family phosphatase